jgi:CubicO group peptidase (beta-lactamase class C family)
MNMRPIQRLLFRAILLAMIVSSGVTLAQSPPTPNSLQPQHLSESDLIAATRKTFAQATAADDFAGAVLIAKNGKPVLVEAAGLADREHKLRNKPKTRFRLGSMNKMFTAVATMQLVQAGKIALDAPLGKYLTDYPNREVAAKVTIHQLLTHTGGTGDIFGPEFDAHRLELRTLGDYVKLYGKRAPEFSPGSRWKYSNYGFILLGVLIERITGQSYYDYVRQHIYSPAGMTSTDSEPEDRVIRERSSGYTKMDGTGQWKPNTDSLPYRGTSAGGGYSTVEDLLRFATALQQHKLLDAPSTELLTSGKVDTPRGRYAYGFEEQTINGARCFGHGGGAPGMNGQLQICPGTGYVVAVLANLDPPAAGRIADFIVNRLPSSGGAAITQLSAPDGPAAKQFAAWLEVFNKGDRAALRAYHEHSFPYSAAREEIASLEREHALSIETAGFDVKQVESASATSYSAIVMDRATHQCAKAIMQVDAGAPHRVVSFDLRVIPKPAEYRQPEGPLDAARRRSLLDAIARVIDAQYIFPEVGQRMIAALREHAAHGHYDKLTDCDRFAAMLTDDLQRVSHDLHLRVVYGEPKGPPPGKPDPRALGFGFGAIDRLPGNVAHVVIHGFMQVDNARSAIAGFMTKVADADALIIDLRENHGGDPETVALVASYLFDDKPVHINDMVMRDGTRFPSWTNPNVSGSRFGGRKPVYVLTSAKTISGGEELAYDLQSLRRAKLIGEKTVGAANPAASHTLDDWFHIAVPGAHPINPITKTNWEGVGVHPDIATNADAALDEALRRVALDIGFTPASSQ